VLTPCATSGAHASVYPSVASLSPAYRIDAGVSTIMFWHGAWFLHHQMSGFKDAGELRPSTAIA
jgi:hypothetical protein